MGNIFQHPYNFEVNVVIKSKSFIQGRLVAKIFFCHPLADDSCVGFGQYVLTLPGDNRKIENLKKFGLCKRKIFFEFLHVAIFFNRYQLFREITNPGDFFAESIVIAKSQSKGWWYGYCVVDLVAMLLGNKPIYPIRIVVKIVEREVISNNGKYQYCACYSQR